PILARPDNPPASHASRPRGLKDNFLHEVVLGPQDFSVPKILGNPPAKFYETFAPTRRLIAQEGGLLRKERAGDQETTSLPPMSLDRTPALRFYAPKFSHRAHDFRFLDSHTRAC